MHIQTMSSISSVLMADLKTRRYPDIENTDVDRSDEHSRRNHNPP